MEALPDKPGFAAAPAAAQCLRIGRIPTIRTVAAAAVLLGAYHGLARADEKFESVAAYLEHNVDDEDCEIRFDAVGGVAGLKALTVGAPDGRTVIDFKAADSRLGMRRLSLEPPEPRNDGRLQADFPAGVYKFTGTSTSGATLQG